MSDRIRPPGVFAALFCGAIACGGGSPPSTGGNPALSVPLLTPGCGSVIVSMSANGGTATQFRVERSTDSGGTWTTVGMVPAHPAPATVTLTGQPSQTLHFRYFASDDEAGPSPVAATIPFAAPDAPTEVDALPGSSRATVTWRLPASYHGSPITQTILADERSAGNRFQFPVAATATRALVGDEGHPLESVPGGAWSFRITASNECGTATSERSRAVQTVPWSLTPTDSLALGTTLYAMATAQVGGTEYLIGGVDDDLQTQGVTLRTSQDPTTPEDGRLLPWRQSGNLNVPRSHLAAAANRALDGDVFLYAIGGRGEGFQPIPDVEAGLIHADGSVEWFISPEVAGSPLSQGRADAAVFVHGQFLYVLGGIVADVGTDAQNLSRDVLVTHINADGTLPKDAIVDGHIVPAWRRAGTTPPGFHALERSGAAVAVVGDYLFVIGGDVLEEESSFPFLVQLNTVHRIKLGDDGTLDCPSECNWVRMPDVVDASGVPFPLASGSAFVNQGMLYYMGGFGILGHGPVLVTTLSADENGVPVSGAWTELPTFSDPPAFGGDSDRDFSAAFNLGSYLYVAGGLSFTGEDAIPTALGDSLFAHLSNDGLIGP